MMMMKMMNDDDDDDDRLTLVQEDSVAEHFEDE